MSQICHVVIVNQYVVQEKAHKNKILSGDNMTRLDRIIKVFEDYDNLVEELALRNSDNSQNNEINKLRNEVSWLIIELEQHGCRRKY